MSSALVLVIDRLGAPFLGPYGNTWIETPAFNRLASESLLVEHTLVDAVELADAYQSMWLGSHAIDRLMGRHGSQPLFPELNRLGISTQLLTDEPEVAGLSLTDSISHCRSVPPPETDSAASNFESTGVATFFAQAVDAVRQASEPTLLWLHCRGMQGPWDAPLEYRQQFVDEEDPAASDFVQVPHRMLDEDHDPDELHGIVCAYAGQLSAVDMCLDVLLDAASEHPRADEWLILITSTRGFPLGEHRCVGQPRTLLYRELLHVPLFVRHPERYLATHRMEGLAQLPDIWCTLADWFGVDSPARSRSLLNESNVVSRPVASCCHGNQWAVRTPAWFARFPSLPSGLSGAPECELFLKPDDAWEVNDVSDRCPEIAYELGQLATQLRVNGTEFAQQLVLSEQLLNGPD